MYVTVVTYIFRFVISCSLKGLRSFEIRFTDCTKMGYYFKYVYYYLLDASVLIMIELFECPNNFGSFKASIPKIRILEALSTKFFWYIVLHESGVVFVH